LNSFDCFQINIETTVDNMAEQTAYTLAVMPETNVFLGMKKVAPPMYAICHSCTVSKTQSSLFLGLTC